MEIFFYNTLFHQHFHGILDTLMAHLFGGLADMIG